MKPDKEGIWEWFDEEGTKRLVSVYNVMKQIPNTPPYWRVYWWGGYYNVNDEHDPETPQYDYLTKAEWPDRWGNFVGEIDSVKEEDLYSMPTPEEMKKIREADHEKNQRSTLF